MDRLSHTRFRLGAWIVDPVAGTLARGDENVRLEARAMRLLLCLAERAGEVVSIDTLLDEAWSGVIVTPDSVYQAVTSLRRALGDDPKRPAYIATVPRLGYRMVATVAPSAEDATPGDATDGTMADAVVSAARVAAPREAPVVAKPPRRHRRFAVVGALILLGLLTATALLVAQRSATAVTAADCSLAVLPFLDLTRAMDEEPFADGMTEELIAKLSRMPGARVPSFTASLTFKGKRVDIADVARRLDVAYVLEGSVRKSGDTVRVTAQLVRADSGYLVWSATYDRPFTDLLHVQDDIAAEVTRALQASLAAGSRRTQSDPR